MDDARKSENDAGLDDEFSLDQLSEAYAKVIRQQNDVDGTDLDPDPASVARGELVAEKVARGDELDDYFEDDADDSEEDDNAACPITPESIVESILFVGAPRGEQLTSRQIASLLRDVSPKEVAKIAKSLNEKYESENAAYRVDVDDGTLRLRIADDLLEFQNEHHGRNREFALSQAAIDTLAVVAYRQPISRDDVEKARNRPVGGVLNQLVKRNLLQTIPAPDKPRLKLYQTTDRFLDLFRLDSLYDLPQSHEVSELDEFED